MKSQETLHQKQFGLLINSIIGWHTVVSASVDDDRYPPLSVEMAVIWGYWAQKKAPSGYD